MNYTNLEKQSIIKILCDMMMIDGHRDAQESQYLNYIKQLLGLSSFSSDSPIDQATALNVISDMLDDQKMEVAGMLQQMIMADGIQDKKEMYFFGQIVTSTGIDKVVERKTAGMNIQYDDAQIYLNSSKIALSRRSPEFLCIVNEQAENFKNMFRNYYLTMDDKCDLIIEYTKDSIKNSGWDLNDVDGITWFIANNTDAMVKAGVIEDYDSMFVKCFKKYFNL